MPDPSFIVQTVEKDVTDVLARMLPDGEGFRPADPTAFARERPISDAEESVAVVAWEWTGRHAEVADDEARQGLFGVHPTGEPVTVRGVTLVTPPWDAPLLHRYIDWVDVMAQIGITVNPRPIFDVRRELQSDAADEVPEIMEAIEGLAPPD